MDTIMIIRDSVATCMNKTAECLQPCVKNAGTSCRDFWLAVIQDVGVTLVICITICFLAWLLYKWKKDERNDKKEEAATKRESENVERNHRLSVRSEDYCQKRKDDLQDRIINYMENRIKEGTKIEKNDPFIEEVTRMIDRVKTVTNNQEVKTTNKIQE